MLNWMFTLMISANLNAAEPDARGFVVRVGDVAPVSEYKLIDGRTLTKSDLAGKVVVLQFTASWCSVCRKEMPHLEKQVWQRFKDRDFVLIGVDRDEAPGVVKKFAKDMGVSYPMALDPGAEIFAKFASKESGVTRNVLIDRQGKINFLTRLFDEKEFQEMIERIDSLSKK